MHVSVAGGGVVGTTVAACFADLGHDVTMVTDDEGTVTTIEHGDAPVYEPGLDPLVTAYGGDRLRATTDSDAVGETDATILAHPPSLGADGALDREPLLDGADSIGAALPDAGDYHLVVAASPLLPGLAADRFARIAEAADRRLGDGLGAAVVPTLQREGSAVDDFMEPDRFVVGTDGDDRALDRLVDLYEPLLGRWDVPIVETDHRTAETVAVATDAARAVKASLGNELGNVCHAFGVDPDRVAEAVGEADGIDAGFLQSGLGVGGSLVTTTAALVHAADEAGYDPRLLRAALELNDAQPERLLSLLDDHADVDGERVAVLGLASAAGSDDLTASRAAPVIEGLQARGAEVVAYDPAVENAREGFADVAVAESAAAALEGASAAVVTTAWEEFARLDAEFDAMSEPVVVDGRRVVRRRAGITYEGLTW